MDSNKRVNLSLSIHNFTPLKDNDFESFIIRYTISYERKHVVLELQTETNKYFKSAFVHDKINLIEVEDNIIVITTMNECRIYFQFRTVREALECQDYLIDKLYEFYSLDN